MSLINILLLVLSTLLGCLLIVPEVALLKNLKILKKKMFNEEMSVAAWIFLACAVTANTLIVYALAVSLLLHNKIL